MPGWPIRFTKAWRMGRRAPADRRAGRAWAAGLSPRDRVVRRRRSRTANSATTITPIGTMRRRPTARRGVAGWRPGEPRVLGSVECRSPRHTRRGRPRSGGRGDPRRRPGRGSVRVRTASAAHEAEQRHAREVREGVADGDRVGGHREDLAGSHAHSVEDDEHPQGDQGRRPPERDPSPRNRRSGETSRLFTRASPASVPERARTDQIPNMTGMKLP